MYLVQLRTGRALLLCAETGVSVLTPHCPVQATKDPGHHSSGCFSHSHSLNAIDFSFPCSQRREDVWHTKRSCCWAPPWSDAERQTQLTQTGWTGSLALCSLFSFISTSQLPATLLEARLPHTWAVKSLLLLRALSTFLPASGFAVWNCLYRHSPLLLFPLKGWKPNTA